MAEITIEFLGTGSAFSKRFGNNSAIMTVKQKEKTRRMMIDCGRTTPDDLLRAGYTWTDLDAIFITHLHGDHIYGLEEAGFIGRYVLGKKPHLIFPDAKIKNNLWERVLKGTMMEGDLDRQMRLDDYFTHDIVDSKMQYFLFNGVMISVYATEHIQNKKSYGLIIGEYKYIVYTSDSLLNKEFMEAVVADGCQAIFHDCQLFEQEKAVHASLGELLSLNQKEREKIYIMHYGDTLPEHYAAVKDSGMQVTLPRTPYEFQVGVLDSLL